MDSFAKFLSINGLKKKDIATYLGVSNAFITQLCAGTRKLPADKLALIKVNSDWDSSMLLSDTEKAKVIHLDHLDRDALKRILTEPKNALMRQYEKMFELDGIKLVVEPEVLDLIVDTSIENKLGARGLRSICEAIMTDAMYEAPSSGKKTFKLTVKYAKEKLSKN